MTNQQAIEILENSTCYECAYGCNSVLDCVAECELKEAMKEAIKALKFFVSLEHFGECYIIPKKGAWIVNGVNMKKVLYEASVPTQNFRGVEE